MELSKTLHTVSLTKHGTNKKELGVDKVRSNKRRAKIQTNKGFDRNQQPRKGNRFGNMNQTNQQSFGPYGNQSYNTNQQAFWFNGYQQPGNWPRLNNMNQFNKMHQFSNMNQSMNQLNYMDPLLMDQLNCMTKQSFGFNNQLNYMNQFNNMNQQPGNLTQFSNMIQPNFGLYGNQQHGKGNQSYNMNQQPVDMNNNRNIPGQNSNFNPQMQQSQMQQFNYNQKPNNQKDMELNLGAKPYIPKNINPNINNMNQQPVNINNSNIPGQNHNFNPQTKQFNDNPDMKLNLEAKPFYPKNINPNINNSQSKFFENGKGNGQGRGGKK